MSKKLKNYLILKYEQEFIDLFQYAKVPFEKFNDSLLTLKQIDDENWDYFQKSFEKDKTIDFLHEFFHSSVVFLPFFSYLTILDGLSTKYSELANLIRNDWKDTIQIIKSFHSRRLQSINLLPISQQKSPFVSVDKFYFPLTIAMYDNLKLSISLSHDDFIQRVFSSPTFSLIIGDAQGGKTTQIHRILYSWSMQESLLSDCFVLF